MKKKFETDLDDALRRGFTAGYMDLCGRDEYDYPEFYSHKIADWQRGWDEGHAARLRQTQREKVK